MVTALYYASIAAWDVTLQKIRFLKKFFDWYIVIVKYFYYSSVVIGTTVT